MALSPGGPLVRQWLGLWGNREGPNYTDVQRAKSVAHELKLLCGVWEHCADPPMFALRVLRIR